MNEIKDFNFTEMLNAIDQAESLIKRAESHCSRMARILCGRLRGINPGYLSELKKELQSFNMKTGEWK